MTCPGSLPDATGPAHPVTQQLVHKLNADEVLLTSWSRTGPDAFSVTARWPPSHPFYEGKDGLPDALLFAETIRQALPLLSHVGYEVPLDHQLIWEDFHYDLDVHALREAGFEDLVLRIRCFDIVRRGRRTAAMSLHAEALRGDVLLGTSGTRFHIQTPAVYQRLRADRADVRGAMARAEPPAAPVPPHRVGRSSARDVVLAPTGNPRRWQLRVETGHPILFDHPVDHVPGMLLLEAVRQGCEATAYPRPVVPVALEARFHLYVELDAPCFVEMLPLSADADGRPRVRLSALQHDKERFSAVTTLEQGHGPAAGYARTAGVSARDTAVLATSTTVHEARS